jgi:hypothetical protein
LINIEWVLICCWLHARRQPVTPAPDAAADELASVGSVRIESA